MKRWKKASLLAAGIVLLLAGFVAFVLPEIVKKQTVQRVEAATGRKLHIGKISLNPLTLTIVIHDFRFSERGSGEETFAAFSSARIAVSPLSFYRGALVIAEARITSPHFRIVRVGTNLYNYSDLLKWLPLHPRLSVNNLTLTNGAVDFIDQGLPVEKRHELRKIELSVPFITTMSYYADRYITPRLSAVLNGSPLHLEGKIRPFPRATEASANIEFKELSLPDYLAYIPKELPVRIDSGRMSAKLALSYRRAKKEKPELSLSGSMSLADMKIADRSGAPLLAMTQLDVTGNLDFGGAEGTRLEKISAQARQLSAPLGSHGETTLAALSLDGGRFSQKEKLLEVDKVILRDGDLRFNRDRKGDLPPLEWESLRLEKIKMRLAPFALDIEDVALTQLNSRIVIDKDGNLQRLSFQEPERKEQAATAGKKRMIRIGTVTMQDSTLTFSDHHVMGGYTMIFFDLGGRITGLSSEDNRFADVALRGSLEKQSPLRITGQINPLRNDFFADLQVSLTAIELPPMTPYSATYLGYAVNKGRLFLDSNYRIANRKLDLENKLRIAQLDFGKRIESDKVISPSVRLAVALLKDRKGEIRFDLPVTGRTDDPKFHLGDLVLELLKNRLNTVAESPFTLLQSLSGVKEELNSVGFASGSSVLSSREQAKLLKLAAALGDRPALLLKIIGYVDREGDDEGYRNEDQLRSLAEARAAEVKAFLVKEGHMDSARLFLKSGDIYRVPTKVGESGSRVEFEVTVDMIDTERRP